MDGSVVEDPRYLIGEAPMSRAQIYAVAITCALCALDGYDVLSVSFAAPGLLVSWGIGKAALGVVLSSGLAGAALGSIAIAPFADVIGRRRMVLATVALMAFGMLMCAFAHSVPQLAAWRVLTGIGIGAMVPIIVPLAAEFANIKRRSLAVAIMSIGYPTGAAIGGATAAALLHWFAWPAVFLLGAALSLLMLPLALLWLPDPLAFLMERRDESSLDRVNALLRRFEQPPVTALPPPTWQPERTAAPYRAVFTGSQRTVTLRIMLVNLLFLLTDYFVLSWMPQMVADAGHSASAATVISSLSSLAGVGASILFGLVTSRFRSSQEAAALMIGLGLATALFGQTPSSFGALAGVAMLTGAFLFSGTVALYTLIVDSFEPRVRVTGVGFVMGVGRISGVLAPAAAGALFAAGTGRMAVSAILGAAAVVAGLIVCLSRTDRKTSCELYPTSALLGKLSKRRWDQPRS